MSQWLVWRIGCVIATQRAAFWAVVALNLSPVFGITTGTWVLPDGPLDTALLGAALCLLYALPASGSRALGWWAAAGMCSGLALFAKYSAALTIGGAFLYLLTSRLHRRWLACAEPYIALVLALVVFSPVLMWNALHHWASFAFQGDRAMGFDFRPLMPIQILAGEALFVLPWIWLPMMILFVRGFRRPWPERLPAWLAAPPIVAFALISGWSSQRVLYHWAAPGYLMLFAPLGGAIADRLDRLWVQRLVAGSAALVLAAVFVIVTQIQFDWLGRSLTTELNADPTVEGLDWTSVHDDLQARGLLPPGTVAAAFNWRDAGKFGYALGPGTTMLCLSTDSRQFGFAHPVRDFVGQDVLLLEVGPVEQAVSQARRWFHSVKVLPGTLVRQGSRPLRTVTVVRGQGLVPQP